MTKLKFTGVKLAKKDDRMFQPDFNISVGIWPKLTRSLPKDTRNHQDKNLGQHEEVPPANRPVKNQDQ